jgi:hypothetical protein
MSIQLHHHHPLMILMFGLLHQGIHLTEGQQEVNPVQENLPKMELGHVVCQRLGPLAVVRNLVGVKEAQGPDHQLPPQLVGEKENQLQAKLIQQ